MGRIAAFKMQFSAWVPEVIAGLKDSGARSVLVCGVETHIAVLQTCIDLTHHGYTVAVCTDAVGSRRTTDHHAAIERMLAGGVIATSAESALMELTVEAGGARFRDLLRLLR